MTTNAIGIDVSKRTLDVADSTGQWAQTYPNTLEALRKIATKAATLRPHRILLEASGGYERLALIALQEAGLPVVLIQPNRARHFARAIGKLAKTDAIDAQVLARMALVVVDEVPLWRPRKEAEQQLRSLLQRRRQLVRHIDAERKWRRGACEPVQESIKRTVAFLKAEQEEIEGEIEDLVESSSELSEASKALTEVCGVGVQTALTLLAEVPELGKLSRGAVSSLVGVAPMNRDSGQFQGQRFIRGGRVHARTALYMATLSAIRFNSHIRDFYTRLKERGKNGKVALVACMRKMLIHLNAKMRAHQACINQNTAMAA